MKIRTISGAVFVSLIVGFFLLREYVNVQLFNILIWFFCAVGTFEVARAVRNYTNKVGFWFTVIIGILVIPSYVVGEYLFRGYGQTIATSLLALSILFTLVYAIIVRAQTSSVYTLPVVYPSIFMLCMSLANSLDGDRGFIALLLIFVISPLADTFAYLVGMTYTKIKKGNVKKLCPKLSPKKTVAGAIGGVIGGAVGAVLVQLVFKPDLGLDYPYLLMAIIGLVGSVLTEAGDLFESAIKRKVGIKDMGKIMPGHGGVMDRIDGICFTSAFMYLVFLLI